MGITIAHRRCADCSRTTGFAFWPWAGQVVVTTHGLCGRCVQQRRSELAHSHASARG